ncbi:DUF5947 family protein [Streptomyces poonensis]|uniref:Uncharacterized protein n=1 Tax=Streptomyces poonensis TaxID=68255 RepID=A0A918PFF6_9ACTN|nr:DUF5947 family protein [Streptomyces poonensis]GGZ03839.1 hypothetical protein GCM10010365_23430 [Streptomyces poonensis]GLJ90782.1 hypothetical protein GCM10017589_33870 [Streptomyces poonensis]
MTARGGLRRYLAPPADGSGRSGRTARCELCDAAVDAGHGHAVDLDDRGLLCVCRACRLLLARRGDRSESTGTARGRYRTVPDRYHFAPGLPLTTAQWEELQIPVGICFLLRNSRLDRLVAFFPSPAGATEMPLADVTWRRILGAGPDVVAPADDVEALLLRRRGTGVDCALVPVDACYRLVGKLRLHWAGFGGGARVHSELDAFFASLRERGRPPSTELHGEGDR